MTKREDEVLVQAWFHRQDDADALALYRELVDMGGRQKPVQKPRDILKAAIRCYAETQGLEVPPQPDEVFAEHLTLLGQIANYMRDLLSGGQVIPSAPVAEAPIEDEDGFDDQLNSAFLDEEE